MFKKTLGFVAVAAAFAGLGLVSTTTANAATADPTTTQASVDLTAGTGTSGAVTLVSAPSIKFTAADALNGSATTAAATVNGKLVVKNAGATTGWNVTLAASPMTATDANESTKTNTLTGGLYTLSTTPKADVTGTDTNTSTAPDSKTVEVNTGSDTTGSASPIMSAAAGAGVGTWDGGLASTSLAVPSSAVEGSYTSTLTWALNNAPA